MKDSRFFIILCVLLTIESDVTSGFSSFWFAIVAFFAGLTSALALFYEIIEARDLRRLSSTSPSGFSPYSPSASPSLGDDNK
jgi:hypothetical protein